MNSLYKSPYKIYLVVFILTLIGLYCGSKLPISLFPNSSKPTVWVDINYGHLNSHEFLENFGKKIESRIQSFVIEKKRIDKVTADYRKKNVNYKVDFSWGIDPVVAMDKVKSELSALSGTWPLEIKNSLHVGQWSRGTGFIAVSFYSEKLSLTELYKVLNPALGPKLDKIENASQAKIWNPERKRVSIILRPTVMANFGLFPRDIESSINRSMQGFVGGSIAIGKEKLLISMDRGIKTLENLKNTLIKTPSNKYVYLREVATVELDTADSTNKIFKTSGIKSLILFSSPKPGGNIKMMAEKVIGLVKSTVGNLGQDIKYRVLVDPSEFIRKSVNNVIHEVILAAFLAVLVLFLFVGSFKNTITAIIEIPLAMILSFIPMYFFDMNLNLISLGGLALAAGMNVDASVVVMENIIRNFSNQKHRISFNEKLKLLSFSIKEVAYSIIASTLSTLVVFSPLAFTSALTNAILGDLAKVVVFSHGFAMIIALVLVPTIRLQLMGKKESLFAAPKSPIYKILNKIQNLYQYLLVRFLKYKRVSWCMLLSLFIGGGIICANIIPGLKKEIIGKPDSDWVYISINTQGNTI